LCCVCLQERNTQLAETTAKLQEEKLRLDALLVRQYNLLAILGKQGGSGRRGNGNGRGGGASALAGAEGGEAGSPDGSETSSKEGLTLGECVAAVINVVKHWRMLMPEGTGQGERTMCINIVVLEHACWREGCAARINSRCSEQDWLYCVISCCRISCRDAAACVLLAERIEAMRRTLAVSTNSSVQDMESIQTTELLGEGTFGKVRQHAVCSNLQDRAGRTL
jgi:hypothetical protein